MDTAFDIPESDVISWRRHFHAHPELSNEEHETAAFVQRVLDGLGIATSRPTPTSVLGILHGTAPMPYGRQVTCVGLRADMDALPVQEQTGEPFASTVPGVMHACGHDAHTAMLLGTAATLANLRGSFAGTVKFFFQHAEEKNPGGAKFMIENGVMDGVDEVFAVHVMNGPRGTIGIAKGNATSSAGGFFVDVQGVGSHGSMPHKGIDPVLCAAQLVVALNHIVSRSLDPGHFVVVNPGLNVCSGAPNIIADSARVGVSIRTYDPGDTEIAYRRCEEVVDGICKAYSCSYEFEWVPPYDIVHNDPAVVDGTLVSARKIVGEERAWVSPPTSGSEDFSEFTKAAPGAFICLNAGEASDGLPFQNHHPKFNIVEDVLALGVRLEVQIVLDRLGVE